ncbi:MAG: transporter [Planctomycetes bacterium]|nr:transporter [Planctomycetota bacterium]
MSNLHRTLFFLVLLPACATTHTSESSVPQEGAAYGFSNPAPWDGPIAPDRPSFGVGTRAIPVGRFQAEVGYTIADDSDVTVHSLPNTLVRIGVAPGIEARISTPGLIFAERAEDGFGDFLVGARFEVQRQDGAVPELSIQPSISLPTGDASGTDSFNPEVFVPMSWSIDDATSVLANVGLQVRTLDVDRQTDLVLSTSALVSRTLSDQVSAFAEYFAVYPERVTGQHSLDFGAAYNWTPDLQIDAAVGFGLNDAATDLFLTFGASSRF